MPKRATPEQQLYRHMKHRYGLEPEQYKQMFIDQDNKCYICGKQGGDVKGTKLHVDHDHKTGLVRKLLCSSCNTAVACIESDKIDDVLSYVLKYQILQEA